MQLKAEHERIGGAMHEGGAAAAAAAADGRGRAGVGSEANGMGTNGGVLLCFRACVVWSGGLDPLHWPRRLCLLSNYYSDCTWYIQSLSSHRAEVLNTVRDHRRMCTNGWGRNLWPKSVSIGWKPSFTSPWIVYRVWHAGQASGVKPGRCGDIRIYLSDKLERYA